jgi:hypothetical protein
MDTTTHKPRLLPRESGGWLAVTEPDDDLHIGVTADTEAEARDRFADAVAAWLRLLDAARRSGVDQPED